MVELSKEESVFLYKMMIDYERIISLSQNPYYGTDRSDLINLKNKLFNGGLNNAD